MLDFIIKCEMYNKKIFYQWAAITDDEISSGEEQGWIEQKVYVDNWNCTCTKNSSSVKMDKCRNQTRENNTTKTIL